LAKNSGDSFGGKLKRSIAIISAALLLGVLALSCGTRDDRNDIRAQYGDPDVIRRTPVDPFWSETWIYNQQGVVFEFRRTSGCGSARDVYLYVTYPILGKATENLPKAEAGPDSVQNSVRPFMPMAPR
jgi:hypothetical protein